MTSDETEKLQTDEFRERMILVVREFAGNKYSYLEERTGISARKWKNMCNRVQQPSIEMLIEIAKVRPYFLTWLVTGKATNHVQVSMDDDNWTQQLLDALQLKQ